MPINESGWVPHPPKMEPVNETKKTDRGLLGVDMPDTSRGMTDAVEAAEAREVTGASETLREAERLREEAAQSPGVFPKRIKITQAEQLEAGVNDSQTPSDEEALKMRAAAIAQDIDPSKSISEQDSKINHDMAISVVPEEQVERIPGVNAPDGDPPYVDEATAEKDIGTAYAQAKEEDSRRTEAKMYRDLAQEDRDAGNSESAHQWSEIARWQDERAGQEGFWAGILHNHPIPEGFEKTHPLWIHDDKVEKLDPETLVELEDYAKSILQTLDDIKHGRAATPDSKSGRDSASSNDHSRLGEGDFGGLSPDDTASLAQDINLDKPAS